MNSKSIFTINYLHIPNICSNFAAKIERKGIVMSEKEKNVEKERKAVLALLLQKTGLKYKELVNAQVGMWMAGNIDLLSEQERQMFPNLAF